MKKIMLNNHEYEIINDEKEIIKKEEIESLLTEYFDDYDYIFGDYAYDKLRLKGFQDSHNKNANKINDIKNLDEYIKKHCAYGARHFLIKK